MMRKMLFLLPFFWTVCANAQLSGTYTISADPTTNPDFTSFNAAVAALSAGVSGPVFFDVEPGTYEEFVTLTAVNGVSSSQCVTFRGVAGSNDQVVLTSNAGYTERNTLTIDGADFVNFENLTIQTTSNSYANVVYLKNGVTNLHFDHVRFIGYDNDNSGYTTNQYIIYDKSTDEGSLDSDLVFTSCSFAYGDYAFYMQGPGWNKPNDTNLLIENCTFHNQRFKSLYLTYQESAVVRGNAFYNNKDVKEYWAIDCFRCYDGLTIENNVINAELNNVLGQGVILRPGKGTAERPVIVRNNMISIHSNANYSYGFYVKDEETDHLFISHNTCKMTGNGQAGIMLVEKNFENFTVNNNVFVNETSGYVFRYSTANTENRVSDYNRISYSGEKFGKFGSVEYDDLSSWQSIGFDAHTDLCAPQFVGMDDLHVVDSEGLVVPNPLAYVTTDIDAQSRSNVAPCAGADEYINGVNLPPVVQNPIADIVFETYPDSQSVALSGIFTDPDDPDEGIQISVYDNSNPGLVGAAIEGGNLLLQRQLNAAGSAHITLEALSNGQTVQTSFSVICHVEDQAPIVVNPIQPIHFTEFPQSFSFDISVCFDDPDNNNLMMVYTVFSCSDILSVDIDEDDILGVRRLTPNAFDGASFVIRATSNGKYVDMEVEVSGDEIKVDVAVADFEDVELGVDGYWQPEEGANEMLSGGWIFTNYYSAYFWGGFTASNHDDLTQTGLDAQYTAVTGKGYDNSDQYAVAYALGAQTMVSPANGTPCAITGCFVTNNLWAYRNMMEGDYNVTPFGGANGDDPDYFVLHAIGKDQDGQTISTADFYLADYRFDNPDDDYIVNTWEWFDLSGLGEVAVVAFSLESSKIGYGGMITPAYFCMDNFNGLRPVDMPPYVINPLQDLTLESFPQSLQVALEGVATDPDDPDENIVYLLQTNTNEAALEASIRDNCLILQRLNENEAEADLVIRAESDGQYVDFEVHVIMLQVEGCDENAFRFVVYPNPSSGSVTIDLAPIDSFDYELRNAQGQCLLQSACQNASCNLDLGAFPRGLYYLSIRFNGQCMTKIITLY